MVKPRQFNLRFLARRIILNNEITLIKDGVEISVDRNRRILVLGYKADGWKEQEEIDIEIKKQLKPKIEDK